MRGRFDQPIKSLGFAKHEDINRRVPDSASFTNSIPNNLFVSSLHSTSHHKEYFINPLTNHHLIKMSVEYLVNTQETMLDKTIVAYQCPYCFALLKNPDSAHRCPDDNAPMIYRGEPTLEFLTFIKELRGGRRWDGIDVRYIEKKD